MSLVCAQCSRVNPGEAAYCFYDGAALAGRAGGPINAGSAPFANQFVFPDGFACRNFDQLAMACQANWSSAISLLKQGFLGSFFGGMGRVDLAMAAQEAAKFPDIDRGLDQLLAKLPTQALQAPKLQAEPSEVNLGQIKINENRASELHLTNLGMRLLYGTVTTDCKWLLLGDTPGHPEKMFQFGSDVVIPVQVRGQHLRAGTKPVEGHLIIDSNGGEPITVTFKADVPIAPYPDGLFAGAVTPREIAEKAKAKPKDASPFFEHGHVANWYASNGWIYPVQGPIMSGVGAIQQFFEALGVGKAPRVDFNPRTLDLQGAVGKTIEASIAVSTADKKVVYGWATCDQPWVEVGKTKLGRAAATIPITIRIPSPCPPTLEAMLNVVGNGNQKAAVPLRVKVAGGKAGVVLANPNEILSVEIIEEVAPMVVELIEEPAPYAVTPAPTPAPAPQVVEYAATIAPGPAPAAPMIVTELVEESPFAISGTPMSPPRPRLDAADPASTTASSAAPQRLPLSVRLMLNLIPVGILFVCLLVLLVHDFFFAKASSTDDEVDPRPFIKLVFNEGRKGGVDYTDTMTFAAHKIDPDHPSTPSVKLNWYENGKGNSTVVQIDGKDNTFGIDGLWLDEFRAGGKEIGKYGGKTRTFDMGNGIIVTQTVTIEPSDPVKVGDKDYKRHLNICLVRYTIKNTDKKTRFVGLRVLMDTCIGDRDDVPFTLPGVKELVTKTREFSGRKVPDFVQILEKPSLREPGIILQLNLRVSDSLEAPNRFLLTRYPVNTKNPDGKTLNIWEVPAADMEDDSCVVMYWDPKDLRADQTRELAYSYGLGDVSATTNNKLGVTVGGATYKGGEFTVLALVADQDAKSVTIDLPEGLKLVDPKSRTQPVERARPDAKGNIRPNPVTWRVIAEREGKHDLTVTTDTRHEQKRRVTITAKSLFN